MSTLTATNAKFRFGEMLAQVSYGKKHIKIKKQNTTVAVVIPIDAYEEYLSLKSKSKPLDIRDLWKKTVEMVSKFPKPSPRAPHAVQIIREIRQSS
jgi:prevent-host-death family protein